MQQNGRPHDWTAEERDHVAALVAEARGTFASARSEQDRLAEWVLANCPGEPSQDGGVVDTVIRLIGTARADGAAEERERLREVARVITVQANRDLEDEPQREAAVTVCDWMTAAIDNPSLGIKTLG